MTKLDTVEAAGALVIDPLERILFIFKDGRWDLPKGMLERRNRPAQTALREVTEETGLPFASLRVAAELVPTSHVSKFGKKRFLKTTTWFLVLFQGDDAPFSPQTSEGIEHCEWFSVWDLDRPLANCPARIRYLVAFWLKARHHLDYAFEH